MADWNATLVSERVFVVQEKADGTKSRVPITKRQVELTRGRETIVFKVGTGKAPCRTPHQGPCFRSGRCQCGGKTPVFTDSRAQHTGHSPLTLRGPLPGEQYTKGGGVRQLTPTAWAAEVERLIGPARVSAIFVQLVQQGFMA